MIVTIKVKDYLPLYDGKEFQALEVKTYFKHYWFIATGPYISHEVPFENAEIIY